MIDRGISPPRAMIEAILPLLSDPVRAVRVETARVIAGVDPQTMTPEQRAAFSSAYQELVNAELIDADRPKTHLNLGLLKTRRQQLNEAEAEYRTALRLDPKFVPAMVNLADLDRQRGLDKDGAELLRMAMAIEPATPRSSMHSDCYLPDNATTPRPYRCFAKPRRSIQTTRVMLMSTLSHSTLPVHPPKRRR